MAGMKRVVRKDTGEILRDERMSEEECQTNLFDEINQLNSLYGQGPEQSESNESDNEDEK
jgi:hypothetical protein